MFDLQVPFFIPLWRRVAIVGLTLGWTAFELLNGAFAWAILFGSIGVYAFYQFFVVWDPKVDED
jgi:hypothetical protein